MTGREINTIYANLIIADLSQEAGHTFSQQPKKKLMWNRNARLFNGQGRKYMKYIRIA